MSRHPFATRGSTKIALLRRIYSRSSAAGADAAGTDLAVPPALARSTQNPPALTSTIDDTLEAGSGCSSHELARAFLETAETGFIEDYAKILAPDAVYLVPGRSQHAGLHHGREDVVAALGARTAPGVILSSCVGTELIAEGQRAVVVVRLDGNIGPDPFTIEVVFHLQCQDDQIIAITEYSSDQYTADRLV